mgnify:CR=1 FL=1
MTASTLSVKITAKTALKNNWIKASAACLIVVFSYLVLGMAASFTAYISNNFAAAAVFTIVSVFLLSPLFFGLIRFFWRMLFGADDFPSSVFYCFSSKKAYMRALKLTLSLLVRAVFFGIVLFVPAFIVDLFAGSFIYDALKIPTPLWTSNLYYLSLFLKSAAAVILAFIMARYYMAPFLIAADENMEVAEAAHMSDIISKRTMLDFIYLIFSFFGWILLSALVFPLIFTMPYILTSIGVHVRFAVAEYNKRIDFKNTESSDTFVADI